MHGDAVARHGDVLAVEARRAAELDAFAIDEEPARAERRAGLGVSEERRDRAVDVEFGIRARVAAVGDAQLEELVALLLHRVGHRLEERAALGEGERAQCGPAAAARVVERSGEVEPVACRFGERLLRSGVEEGLVSAGAGDPAAGEKAAQFEHPGILARRPAFS